MADAAGVAAGKWRFAQRSRVLIVAIPSREAIGIAETLLLQQNQPSLVFA